MTTDFHSKNGFITYVGSSKNTMWIAIDYINTLYTKTLLNYLLLFIDGILFYNSLYISLALQ